MAQPSPVWCIGTFNEDGSPNVMTASWAGICSSDPPSVAVSLRKATRTHGNILKQKAFTVSVPPKKFAREADYFGIVSGRKRNKFKDTGLTPAKAETVNAPYVDEFPLILECRLIHVHELGLHTQFVGEILDVKAEESILSQDGSPDMSKLGPILYGAGGELYYSVGEPLGRAFEIGRPKKQNA